MDGLIELVFESVANNSVCPLLNDLLQGSDIVELSHSELGSLDAKTRHDLIQLLNQNAGPSSIAFRAVSAKVGDIQIRTPYLQVLRFEGLNEVAISFASTDIEPKDRQHIATKLAEGAAKLAGSAGVTQYYCGFEPATDERTQLFAGGKMGPLTSI